MAPPRPRSRASAAIALVTVLAGGSLLAAPVAAEPAPPSGFRALRGAAAAEFRLPPDVRPATAFDLEALGLTVERYQQHAAPSGAAVDGGQLTVFSRDGRQVLVVGGHYPAARARNRVGLDRGRAIALAAADRTLGRPGGAASRPRPDPFDFHRSAELRLDPTTRRLYYRVETAAFGVRQFHSVDAETGAVFDAIDVLAENYGTGVKGDRKSVVGGAGTADDLTHKPGTSWRMRSVDGRLNAYDARNAWSVHAFPTDADNVWTGSYQRAAVDAQFYARISDDHLRRRFGLDLVADCSYPEIASVVHAGSRYANAFWDGRYLVYGDGDGFSFRPLSGAQDVVSHELVHAVTECTSWLLYEGEPGALNESFSDILATTMEHALAEPTTSRCRRATGQSTCADWWIAEDVWIGGGSHGIRSLATPAAADQPSHYAARYTGQADNGGVHINSGIPNHAFYLLAHGGRNAACARGDGTAADCDVHVPGVGMGDAETIAFLAYVGLPANASFCDARASTIAAAETAFAGSVAHEVAAALSWEAVGVGPATCATATPDFMAALEARSQAAAPGGTAELDVLVDRIAEDGDVEVSIVGLPAGWAPANPLTIHGPDGAALAVPLGVPASAAAGVHPFLVEVSSPSMTESLAASLIIDATPPEVGLAVPRLSAGTVVPTAGGVPVVVTWSASDAMSGLADARLELSTNGGPWADAPGLPPAGSPQVLLGSGAHAFRVRATDAAGNVALSPASAAVTVSGHQEGAATYSTGWSALPSPQTWGSARYAKTSERSATFRFTGREVAWVSQAGPRRGKARVYLDGVLVARVNLYAATAAPRRVVFAARDLKSGVEHRLRIVTVSPSDRPRVDVDGFLVLSR